MLKFCGPEPWDVTECLDVPNLLRRHSSMSSKELCYSCLVCCNRSNHVEACGLLDCDGGWKLRWIKILKMQSKQDLQRSHVGRQHRAVDCKAPPEPFPAKVVTPSARGRRAKGPRGGSPRGPAQGALRAALDTRRALPAPTPGSRDSPRLGATAFERQFAVTSPGGGWPPWGMTERGT